VRATASTAHTHTHTLSRIDNEHIITPKPPTNIWQLQVSFTSCIQYYFCVCADGWRDTAHTHTLYARADMQGVIRVLILMRADVDMRGACQIIYSAHEAHTPVSLIFSQHVIHTQREKCICSFHSILICVLSSIEMLFSKSYEWDCWMNLQDAHCQFKLQKNILPYNVNSIKWPKLELQFLKI
jgi:hypothetical protein